MFRASSEIAVAIRVSSLEEKPSVAASTRPFCRAETMSVSSLIRTTISSSTRSRERSNECSAEAAAAKGLRSASTGARFLGGTRFLLTEKSNAFFQVKRCRHSFQFQTKLHHGERNIGLDSDDDRLRAAQSNHECNVTERARGEGIHHVQGGDVDNDAAGAQAADLLDEGVTQLHEIRIGERRLNRRDEIRTLFENRDFHNSSLGVLCLFSERHNFVAKEALGFFDPPLEVADR